MTPAELDAVLDAQIRANLAHDVDAAVMHFAADASHEFVGLSDGTVHGLDAIRGRYKLMYESLADEDYHSVRRAYGSDFVVDELRVTAAFTGKVIGLAGDSRFLTGRCLHTCEFRDGLIVKETHWLDTAELVYQMLAPKISSSGP